MQHCLVVCYLSLTVRLVRFCTSALLLVANVFHVAQLCFVALSLTRDVCTAAIHAQGEAMEVQEAVVSVVDISSSDDSDTDNARQPAQPHTAAADDTANDVAGRAPGAASDADQDAPNLVVKVNILNGGCFAEVAVDDTLRPLLMGRV